MPTSGSPGPRFSDAPETIEEANRQIERAGAVLAKIQADLTRIRTVDDAGTQRHRRELVAAKAELEREISTVKKIRQRLIQKVVGNTKALSPYERFRAGRSRRVSDRQRLIQAVRMLERFEPQLTPPERTVLTDIKLYLDTSKLW